MLSELQCLTALFTIVYSMTSPLEYFKDVSNGFPKNNIELPRQANRRYPLDMWESKDQAVEICAVECLEFPYLCRYFTVYEEVDNMSDEKERYCQLFSTLGTKFGESRNKPYRAVKNVLAVYEQRDIPTEQDLIKRLSLSSFEPEMEQQLNMIANKYAISLEDQDCSNAVLKHLKAAFDSKLPTTVNINRWLKGFDISESRVNVGSDFKLALKEGLQSWNSWPENENSPLEFSDIVVLTFIEIFFQSLNQGIETIFDPVAKILIIEGQRVHMMIQSFGPGNYVIINGRNRNEEHEKLDCSMFYLTTDTSHDEEMKTSTVFPKAMEHFHHEVDFKDDAPFDIEEFGNKLELGVKVIINAIGLGLLSRSWMHYFSNGLDVLYRDIVSVVISEILRNEPEEKFQSVLHQTLKRTNLQSKMIDASIII